METDESGLKSRIRELEEQLISKTASFDALQAEYVQQAELVRGIQRQLADLEEKRLEAEELHVTLARVRASESLLAAEIAEYRAAARVSAAEAADYRRANDRLAEELRQQLELVASARETLRLDLELMRGAIAELALGNPVKLPEQISPVPEDDGVPPPEKRQRFAYRSYFDKLRDKELARNGWRPDSVVPDCVFIGAQKTASAFIAGALANHPDTVVLPKDYDLFGQQWIKGPAPLARLIERQSIQKRIAGKPYVVEMTSTYFNRPEQLKRIKQHCGPKTKIIFVMRRPIEYAFSLYNNGLRNAGWESSLSDWINGNSKKFAPDFDLFPDFYTALSDIYEIFGLENALVLQFESDIQARPRDTIAKILNFLGLESSAFPIVRENIGYHPHYLFKRDDFLQIHHAEGDYVIPANTLVWCTGNQAAQSWEAPSEKMLARCMERSARWTQEIPAALHEELFELRYRENAERIQREFKLPIAHWFENFPTLRYALAPPPARYLVG